MRYEDGGYDSRRNGSYDDRSTKRSRTYSRSPSRSPYRTPLRRDERVNPSSDINVRDKRRDLGGEHEASNNSRLDPSRDVKRAHIPDRSTSAVSGQVGRSGDSIDHDGSSRPTPTSTGDVNHPGEPVDEAALIEQRRKRREAIKNKYRGHAPPLLVRALNLAADSAPASPGPESVASTPRRSGEPLYRHSHEAALTWTESPNISSPQTPRDNSAPQSPANVEFETDADLTNADRGSPAADGPSAADYDPTVDMEEERARHDKQLFQEDDRALEQADQQAINAQSETSGPPPKADGDYDMFGDEEDDMFSDAPVKPKPEVKAAQTLKADLMDNWDDAQGYYITILGELLEQRYHVTQTLGRGMFSSVVRATDTQTDQPVAIKIVRNNESMRKAGIKEIDILKDIGANDPEDKKHVIKLHRSFDHKGHLCMVFENLSLNLRELLKKFGRDVGINLKAIRAYSQQLFLGLSLLKKCQYIHADLKPDNILVNEARSTLKICDLGSASPIRENATAPYLVSRFYRAPEIILGIPYDYGIDVWSVGCTLFELYTGKILFTGHNNNGMLRAIMECRGKFSHKLLRRGAMTYDHFDNLLNFRAEEVDKVTGRTVTKMIDIKGKPVKDLKSRLMPRDKKLGEQERKELELFVDLLDKCLDLRPDKRITPNDALKHPFILRTKV